MDEVVKCQDHRNVNKRLIPDTTRSGAWIVSWSCTPVENFLRILCFRYLHSELLCLSVSFTERLWCVSQSLTRVTATRGRKKGYGSKNDGTGEYQRRREEREGIQRVESQGHWEFNEGSLSEDEVDLLSTQQSKDFSLTSYRVGNGPFVLGPGGRPDGFCKQGRNLRSGKNYWQNQRRPWSQCQSKLSLCCRDQRNRRSRPPPRWS